MVRNILNRSSHSSKACRDEVCWICKGQPLDPYRRGLLCPHWLSLPLPPLYFCSTDFRVAVAAHTFPVQELEWKNRPCRGCSCAVTQGSWYIKCHSIFLFICLQVPGIKGCIQNRFIRIPGSSQNWWGALRTKGKGQKPGPPKNLGSRDGCKLSLGEPQQISQLLRHSTHNFKVKESLHLSPFRVGFHL